MAERYLIGNRFVLAEKCFRFHFVDLKGELYDILGKFGCNPLGKFGNKTELEYRTLEDLLYVRSIGAYSDGKDLYWVLKTVIDSHHWVFVIRDEIVSYGVLTKNYSTKEATFYINHYGKEIRGRVVPKEKFYFKRKRGGLEIGYDGREAVLGYVPFAGTLTPLIEGRIPGNKFVVLPELGKAYNGEDFELGILGEGLRVNEVKRNGIASVYMLIPEGEYLIYRNAIPKSTYWKFNVPSIEKAGNVILVGFYGSLKGYEKRGLVHHPNFHYLFVRFSYERDGDGKYREYVYISFDMENWEGKRGGELIYKKEKAPLVPVKEPLQHAKRVSLAEVEAKYKEYWKAYKEREVHQISI